METSANSAGSALIENEKYLDSINGRISILKATWEDFSQAVLNGDIVKGAISGATALLEVFSKISNMVNTPALLGGGYVAFKEISRAIKGRGIFQQDSFGAISINDQSSVGRIAKTYKQISTSFTQMRKDGASFKTSLKEAASVWWNGPSDAPNRSSQIDRSLKQYKLLTDEINSGKLSGDALENAKAQKERVKAYMDLNPVLKEYVDRQDEAVKAGEKGNYTLRGAKDYADAEGKNLDKLGKNAKLASIGMKAANIAAGALQGALIGLAIQGTTMALGALHKELFTTAEEMQTARAAAENYSQSMSSLEEYRSAIDAQRDIYEDPTSSLDERYAAYQQVSSLQSELIDKYGQEAASINMLTASADAYAKAMSKIKYQESYDLLFGNGRENLEGLSKAADEMTKIQTNSAYLGWLNKDAVGADVVVGDLQKIADKYDEVSYEFREGTGWELTINADAKDTQKIITDLQKDVDSKMSDWKKQGIDASAVFAELGDTSDLFSGAYANVSKTISQYGEASEQYFQARIATSDDYSKAADKIIQKEKALQDALAISDEKERYKAVKAAIDDLKGIDLAAEVGESWGKSSAIDNYLQGMLEDAEASIEGYEFEFDLQGAVSDKSVKNTVTDLRDQLESAFGGMDVGNIIDYWKRFDMDDVSGMTSAQVDALKMLRDVTNDYNITVDEFLSSLENVGLAYGDISKLAYDAADSLNSATTEFEKAASGASVNEAISKVGSNRGILDQDAYKNLIAASSDYARAIDYENGYVTLNIQKAHELAKAKAELAMSSIEEQKSMDTERYRSNMAELYNLMSQSDGALNEATKERIAELQSENEAIASNIGMYNVYMSQLKQMSSAYTAWKQTSESNNSDVTSKDMMTAIKQMKDFREDGQTGVGNVQYQMAVEMLVPDGTDVDDVGEYISNKLNRYFKENHPEKGVQNWLTDMVEAGWMTENDGDYKLIDTANLEQAAKSLNITTDAMEALVGLANMYAQTEIKFNDPADISNGMNLLNDYTDALQRVQQAASTKDVEGFETAKADLKTIKEEIDALPEDTKIALGIEIDETKNGEKVSETDGVAKSVENEINELQKLQKQKEDALNRLKELNIDPGETIFGNIDLNDRGVIEWTEDNLKKYHDVLAEYAKMEYGDNASKQQVEEYVNSFRDSISTVFGGSEAFTIDGQNVEIAFSPMLQTEDGGAELLSPSVVDNYISQVIDKAMSDGEWSADELLKLDAEGLDVEGKHIQGLIADIGETAIATGEAMHYLGKDGALSLLDQQIQELSGGGIEVDENSKNLLSYLDEINGYKVHIQTETDLDTIEAYNSQIDETAAKANEIANEKFQLDFEVDVTSIDSLLQAYDKVDTKEEQKEILFYVSLAGEAEVHAKISELEGNIAEWEQKKAEKPVGADTSELDEKINTAEHHLSVLKGTEVGVKVTSSGLDELYTKAEGLLAEIQTINGSDMSPEVKAGQINDVVAELNTLNSQIQEAGGQAVEIPVELREGDNGFQTIANQAAQGVTVPIKVDATAFAGSIKTAVASVGEQKVSVTADASKLNSSITTSISSISGSARPVDIKAKVDTTQAAANVSSFIAANTGKIVTLKAVVDTSGASTSIAGIKDNSGTVSIKGKVTVDAKKAQSDIKAVQKAKISNKSFTIRANGAAAVLSQLRMINNTTLRDKTVTIRTINITENRSKQTGPQAAGGTNYAPGGRTLVGEIGPEMVVSKGRYYMVGQKGAEFVNLKRGDIVFNHLDTMRLLADKAGVRGQALADGGVVTSGPAYSSGSINLTKALSASKTSKTSSNKKSSTSSNKAAKSLTTASKKATEDLDKKVEELAKELSKILENFDAAVDVELKKRGNLDNIIKTYKDAQDAIHKQAEKYRGMGIDENSKYINELKSQWYDYKDKIGEAIQKIYEYPIREAENNVALNKNWMKQAIRADDIAKAETHLTKAMAALAEQQQLLHEEADRLRSEGFSNSSEEVSELSLKWWDLQEDRLETQIELYDAINERVEATSDLYQKLYDTATGEGNRHNMQIAQSYILGSLEAQKNVIESQIIAYRELGYDDASKEIKELQTKWYDVSDAVDEARDKMIEALNDIVDRASDAIDEIQDVYKTLHDAAEEYAKNGGYISVDSFQEIMKLGPKYMQYLEDENGLLTINDEKINNIIAAKTEEAAIESALTYLEQIKIALLSEDAESLSNLLNATTSATDGTWGLVYATASLLKNMGMSDSQYNDMMWNIEAFKTLADSSIADLKRLGENGGLTYDQMIKRLEDAQDSIDDFIKYVMDMLEDRLEDQIDKLEELQDNYKEIISLKKESLKASKEENDYQKSIAEKVKEAAKLQGQIQLLSLDDSREARAQRIKLEEQLADIQNDISDKQADYAIDRQEEMLDNMNDAYAKSKDEEIEKLKETYSSKEKLYRAAVEYMNENPETVYDEVLAWNYEQGSVLQREIEEAWLAAQAAVKEYGGTVKEVLDMIRIEIKRLNDETGGKNDDVHYDVVAKMKELDKAYTDEESIRAILNMMEENSADWINGEHVSSHASNKFLAKMLEQYGIFSTYDDKKGEWYLDDGRRLYDVYGTGYASYASPGEVRVNEAVALEDIAQTAEAMRRNSENWHKAETKEEKNNLRDANIRMANDLKGYGFVLDNSTGSWVITKDPFNTGTVGQNFFETYMPDGSVNKGVREESDVYTITSQFIDGFKIVADKAGEILANAVIPNSARKSLAFDTGAFGSVTPTQEYNISFGDTYITGTAEENIKAYEQVTRDFTNEVLKQLNIRR